MDATISLAMIVRDEESNIVRLIKSIRGCFDELVLCDTGSEDQTIPNAVAACAEIGLDLKVVNFEWVDDFAKARNFAFSHATKDFIMWMDADDILPDPASFIQWRKNLMDTADFWVATYDYAQNEHGQSVCKFWRERAVRRSKNLKWKYFLHEGILPINVRMGSAPWEIKHMRSAQDLALDGRRNLRILEKNIDKLDPRMQFYYGKELFDKQQPLEAIEWLNKAITSKDIEIHDRLLAFQYAGYSYMALNQFEKAIGVCLTGLQLYPHRAELYCIIADGYVKQNKHKNAIPFLEAARACINEPELQLGNAVFTHADCYGPFPTMNLAQTFANLGKMDEARKYAIEARDRFHVKEAQAILDKIDQFEKMNTVKKKDELTEVQDIVISCPPGGLYEWDDEIAEKRGVGGSEIAVIELAREFKKLYPDRRVIVFNTRATPSNQCGVEYIPNGAIPDYFSQYYPALHIAWRHTIKITNAKTLVWSHDLITPGIEKLDYDKLLCLSDPHKNFVQSHIKIPDDKIEIVANGLKTSRYKGQLNPAKEKGVVIYSSSPDRGLESAIKVMDEVVKVIPYAQLQCFYGFDNMLKMGRNAEVEQLKGLLATRPWVKFMGNLQQDELKEAFESAEVWLYPTNFFETFCITSLEALAAKVYPVARNFGALPYTLRKELEKGYFKLHGNCESAEEIALYAKEVIEAIEQSKWKDIDFDVTNYTWEAVAKDWAKRFIEV